MTQDAPKPRPTKMHKPWSRGFFMQPGPQIDGSNLYYTSASTQGFLMPKTREEVMRALEVKKEDS